MAKTELLSYARYSVSMEELGSVSQNLCLIWVLRDEEEFASGEKGQEHFPRRNNIKHQVGNETREPSYFLPVIFL